MENKKGIFGNRIVRNLLGAALAIVLLVLLINIVLGIITRHGQSVEVPDFTNMTFEEAAETASLAGLNAETVDSVYVMRMKRGAVFSQNPAAGSAVKKGRRILLTINALTPKKIKMPSLVGYSMRQAKAELTSRGLSLGRLIYISDIATNNVLRQVLGNSEIKPGTLVESGSEIDLVVGLNSEDSRTYAPDVVGMKYLRAVDAVHENSLNVSRLVFDGNIKTYNDSLNATVYRQSPASSEIPLTMGSGVSLYLK